jgi:hypothetical protein
LVFGEDERDKMRREKKGEGKGIDEIIEDEWTTLNRLAKNGNLGRGVTIRVR